MLRPIPSQLLTDTATICVCTGVDVWQNETVQEYVVSRVHLQDSNETRKTASNTEVRLRSVLFIDSVRSAPTLDYRALIKASEAAGKPLRVTAAGNSFEVATVEFIPNVPSGRLHHIEMGLV